MTNISVLSCPHCGPIRQTNESKLQEYVLILPKAGDDHFVLLVTKDRPLWQRGRLNLLGGHVEEGESPEDAAARELKEESGLDCLTKPIVVGKILARDCVIYCCVTHIERHHTAIQPREGETEEVKWYFWQSIKDDRRLMPNLRVIIPLMQMGVFNWELTDMSSLEAEVHETILRFLEKL